MTKVLLDEQRLTPTKGCHLYSIDQTHNGVSLVDSRSNPQWRITCRLLIIPTKGSQFSSVVYQTHKGVLFVACLYHTNKGVSLVICRSYPQGGCTHAIQTNTGILRGICWLYEINLKSMFIDIHNSHLSYFVVMVVINVRVYTNSRLGVIVCMVDLDFLPPYQENCDNLSSPMTISVSDLYNALSYFDIVKLKTICHL